MHGLTRQRWGRVTHWLIQRFINFFHVDMTQALTPEVQHYADFNAFFTRALKPEARPLAQTALISPVDGEISQIGAIEQGQLLQVKGHHFSLNALLGGDEAMTQLFEQGLFCTIYLAPKDYHRIHMPIQGELQRMLYLPGRLFSVNWRTARSVPDLFARNERVICLFTTECGPVAVILVGAIFVGSMETVWEGQITPPYVKHLRHWMYETGNAPVLAQCDELGRFNMGSTVIVLCQSTALQWQTGLASRAKIQMGQALGALKHD
jgi:phosphatidylserine decarboxylase